VQGTGLQQMLHSTSCHRPFYFNPRQMYALCVCVLDAFAVSTQLIANSANVQTNWEFGISGFGNVIMSLRSGTTHDDIVMLTVQHCITFVVVALPTTMCSKGLVCCTDSRYCSEIIAGNDCDISETVSKKPVLCTTLSSPCSYQQHYHCLSVRLVSGCTHCGHQMTDILLAVASTPALLLAIFNCHQHDLPACL